MKLCRSRSRAAIADSGSCRFHYPANINFPKTSHRSSTRQRRRWLNLAAIMAQFLTAVDTIVALHITRQVPSQFAVGLF